MSLCFTIALRFLFVAQKARPFKIFSLICLLGILFSVMLFLLIDSIINGLAGHLKETLLGFEAPVTIVTGQNPIDNVQTAISQLSQRYPDYGLLSAYVSQFDGLIQGVAEAPLGVRVRGVDQSYLAQKTQNLNITWFEGFDADSYAKSDNLALLGLTVFQNLQFRTGDEEMVVITHPFADLGPSGEIEPNAATFAIAGIFETGRTDFDEAFVLISQKGMSNLASSAMLENEFFVFSNHNTDAQQIKAKWLTESGLAGTRALTWQDKNANLFRAMALERAIYFFVLMLVIAISCFNLAALITIFGVSKAQAMAVLTALGLQKKRVVGVFVSLGFFLGGLGTAFGLAIGMILITVVKTCGFSLPEAYGFTALPLAVNGTTVLLLLLCTPCLAGLIAAVAAVRVNSRPLIEMVTMA